MYELYVYCPYQFCGRVLVRFVYGLVLYTIIVHPWFGWLFLRFHLILSFRRMYFRFILRFIFPFKESLWTIHPCVQGFYLSMLVASRGSLWMNVQKWWIPIQLCIYLKIHHIYIYIYLKIQTYANIRPQAWHMLERELKIHTNASMNSTKVKTPMYFLGDS